MFCINKNIFFRVYNGEAFVADTKQNKYYIFNESMSEILLFLKEKRSANADEILEHFLDLYDIQNTEELKNDVLTAVEYLVSCEVICDDFDIEKYMTLKAIEKNQLYHALIELTYRCNLECKHCYAETNAENELNTQQIKEIIDQLAEMNVMYLTFTGGEVFIREDFIEILDYAVAQGFVIEIFSNGVLVTDEQIRHLSEKCIKCFHCSIYSHIPAIHNGITGVKGSFEKTIRTLKRLKKSGTKINIKTVIMKDNQNDIEGIISLAEEIGASLQVGLNITPKNSGDLSPTMLRVNSLEKYEEILRILNKSKSEKVTLGKVYERTDEDNLCGAGLCSISINPYGEVFPCNGLSVVIGDLKKNTIKEIWHNSKELKQIRNKTFSCVEGCQGCNKKSYCTFCMGQAYLENNGQLKKYDEACMLAQASFNIQETIQGEEERA